MRKRPDISRIQPAPGEPRNIPRCEPAAPYSLEWPVHISCAFCTPHTRQRYRLYPPSSGNEPQPTTHPSPRPPSPCAACATQPNPGLRAASSQTPSRLRGVARLMRERGLGQIAHWCRVSGVGISRTQVEWAGEVRARRTLRPRTPESEVATRDCDCHA